VATYVVGDVQGCHRTLMALVAAVGFEPAKGDRMLFVGDLVNRGPHNVDVLRWMMAQGPAVDAVLGNHDLHLLARARGLSDAKPRDTLDDVLTAPPRERAAWLDWLRHRPFVLKVTRPRHFDQHFVQDPGTWHLVHAGWPPGMTPGEAECEAAALEARLRGRGVDGVLRALREPAVPWSRVRDGRDARARQRTALQAFVHIRTCHPDGTPDPTFSGALADRPSGHRAWFDFDAAPRQGTTIVFGHWAALGLHAGRGVLCLDTGAAWGRELAALRLEDSRIFRVDTVDALTP